MRRTDIDDFPPATQANLSPTSSKSPSALFSIFFGLRADDSNINSTHNANIGDGSTTSSRVNRALILREDSTHSLLASPTSVRAATLDDCDAPLMAAAAAASPSGGEPLPSHSGDGGSASRRVVSFFGFGGSGGGSSGGQGSSMVTATTPSASPATGSTQQDVGRPAGAGAGAGAVRPCTPLMRGYRQCLEVNPDAKANCTWALDRYMKCHEDMGSADEAS